MSTCSCSAPSCSASSSPPFVGPQLIGRIEVFYGGPAGPGSTPGLVLVSRTGLASFGEVLALGDVTGDGICDLAVASPREGAMAGSDE